METSSKDQNGVSKERRSVRRLEANLEVSFRIICGRTSRQTKSIPVSIKNLSVTGFCLATDMTMVEDLHVMAGSSGGADNTLEVRIRFPDQNEILIHGAACWYNLAESGALYRYKVGVRIKKISETDLALLKKFLRRNRKEMFYNSLLRIKWIERLLRGFLGRSLYLL
ncbi:MAG: hypothetical protein AABY87_11160 [bacterium]